MRKLSCYWMAIVFGVMLGYGWCYYHKTRQPIETTVVIEAFTTYEIPLKHKVSRKYMTSKTHLLENTTK